MADMVGIVLMLVGVVAVQALIYRDSVRRGVHNSTGARIGLACGVVGTVLGTLFGLGGALLGMLS